MALHGGQGAASSRQFRELTSQQRSQVRAFLETLGPDGASRVVQPAETEVPVVRLPVDAPTTRNVVNRVLAARPTRYAGNRLRVRRQAALAAERRRRTLGAIGIDEELAQVGPAPRLRPNAAERIKAPRGKSDQRVVEKAFDPLHLLQRKSILDGDAAGDAREQEPGRPFRREGSND